MSSSIKNVFFVGMFSLIFSEAPSMNIGHCRHALENLKPKATLTERTCISNADIVLTDKQVQKILTGWHRHLPRCGYEPIKVSPIPTNGLQENDCGEILNKFFANREEFKKNININLVWLIVIRGKLTEEDRDDLIKDRIPDIIALLDGASIKGKRLSDAFANKNPEEQTTELREILNLTELSENLLTNQPSTPEYLRSKI